MKFGIGTLAGLLVGAWASRAARLRLAPGSRPNQPLRFCSPLRRRTRPGVTSRDLDRLHAQALASLHPLSRRWPHAPVEQCRRARFARYRSPTSGVVIRRLRSWRRAGYSYVHPDRHGKTQRTDPRPLARRTRVAPHRRSSRPPSCTTCSPVMEAPPNHHPLRPWPDAYVSIGELSSCKNIVH